MAGFTFDSTNFGDYGLDVERDGTQFPFTGGAPLDAVGVPGSTNVYFQAGTPQPNEVIFRCRVQGTTHADLFTKLDNIATALDTDTTEELQFADLDGSRHYNGRWDHHALVPEWLNSTTVVMDIRFLVEPEMEDD